MREPPVEIQPLLMDIELTVLKLAKERPALIDKEIELTYDQLKTYFQKLAQGKDLDAPSSTISRRQLLIDAILDVIEQRKDMEKDDHLVNTPDFKPGGNPFPNIESIYVMCFNNLASSVHFWRLESGPKGYLNYIRQFLGAE
ncbi:MAG TPA: hypothetical protein PKA00_23065 [Saprospiraceae bacterium]|nr:hypothetical protein [Saprospiraceae bacterium]